MPDTKGTEQLRIWLGKDWDLRPPMVSAVHAPTHVALTRQGSDMIYKFCEQ